MKDLRLHVRSIFALKVVRAIFYNQKSRYIIFFYILTGGKLRWVKSYRKVVQIALQGILLWLVVIDKNITRGSRTELNHCTAMEIHWN